MADRMTQIKFTIDFSVVAAFKARCASEGVSMTSEICRFMKTSRPVRAARARMITRPERRKAVAEIIALLNNIMEAEAEYHDNIPDQFEWRREAAEHACDQLAEAITCLEDAF